VDAGRGACGSCARRCAPPDGRPHGRLLRPGAGCGWGRSGWSTRPAGSSWGAALGLAVVWVGASVALLSPGQTQLRSEVARSEIVKQLNAALPPRTLLNLLARIDPFPSIAGPGGPSLPPDAGVLRDRQVQDATKRVVKILGTACGIGVEGSGWFAGRDLVVTAAHVVAGEDRDTTVQIPGDPLSHRADIVLLDIRNDIALLRVPGADQTPLKLADPRDGAAVAILGYPLNGGLTVTPGRIGHTATVLTQDALGRGPWGGASRPWRAGSSTATPAARRWT
jgi:Trypsin-like serine proteases, typically periplasmic, contain C-terminal PDZ domain